MPKYWFHHVHLISPEPLKTAEFYEKMIGAKRLDVTELDQGKVAVRVTLDGVKINIIPPRAKPLLPGVSPNCGVEHLGIKTDNIEVAVQELKAKGAEFIEEITAWPALQAKYAFFLAPDNVLVELVEMKD